MWARDRDRGLDSWLRVRSCRLYPVSTPLQELVGVQQRLLAGRSKQAVSADVVQALGQHVLQEALQERLGGQRLVHGRAGAMALEAESDLAVFEALESAVGQRTLEQIAAEILQHLLTRARVLTMHHPRSAPELVG